MMALLIAVAGSGGAVSRFWVDGHIRTNYRHQFPWATLLINATGSLLLGILTGLLSQHHDFTNIETILGTGFCGGYTTFSTASFETVRLLEERRHSTALGHAVGGLLLTILCAGVGVIAGRVL